LQNFAIIGVGGFVAPRHLQAIHETQNAVIAAVDPNDSVGILDRYSFDIRFFREIERFDRFLEKLRRGPEAGRVHYVSICSPNYLHDAHVRLALRVGAHAICEKPLVINPWNLDALEALEQDSGRDVHTVLQLRFHPALLALRDRIAAAPGRHRVTLTYVTARGGWYMVSWKGSEERSGGLAMNIGIHLFDLLLWLFGPAVKTEVHWKEPSRMAGFVELRNADVTWLLSIDPRDLGAMPPSHGGTTWRSIDIDGEEVEFTKTFTDLHTTVYQHILAGDGPRIADARPSIELVHRIRHAEVGRNRETEHPLLERVIGGAA
jgi:UDP-N-acetyl-2-amino-2-deoxyglucuronate dehydrogenase